MATAQQQQRSGAVITVQDSDASNLTNTMHQNEKQKEPKVITLATLHLDGVDDDSSDAPKPIDNFPVPRELRDEIYGYLLSGSRIQYTPGASKTARHSRRYAGMGGAAHTYDFSTELLATSKAIRDDAEEYLYLTNDFILINFAMQGFHMMLHTMDVPIVTDRNITSFKHHVATMDLKWEGPLLVSITENFRDLAPPRGVGSVLLLVRDFLKFCEMLPILCQYTVIPSVYITSSRGGALRPRTTESTDTPVIDLSLHSTRFKTLTANQQSSVLESLQTIVGAGYKLTLTGFSNDTKACLVRIKWHQRLCGCAHWNGIGLIQHWEKSTRRIS